MTNAGMKMWVAMGEGRGGELGFLTTNERKEEMCLLLREAMKCSRISVHKQFVSLSLGSEKGKSRLRDELSNYCVINDVPKSAFGKVCRLSGQSGQSGQSSTNWVYRVCEETWKSSQPCKTSMDFDFDRSHCVAGSEDVYGCARRSPHLVLVYGCTQRSSHYVPPPGLPGKLSGHQDDTAVALQIALLSSKIFYQADRCVAPNCS
jgi:hypothetical protein